MRLTGKMRRLLFTVVIPLVIAIGIPLGIHLWGPGSGKEKPPTTTTTYDGTAHATLTESLATGVRQGCGGAVYYVIPYLHCYVDIDPGPTAWINGSLGGVSTTSAILFMAGRVCGFVPNAILAGACDAAVTVNGTAALWAMASAANQHKCFQETYDVFPSVGMANPVPSAHGGAHWSYPYVIAGETYAVWVRNDACVVNMTDPWERPPYGYYPGVINPWFFAWRCGDTLRQYYPQNQRLNYDGFSCERYWGNAYIAA